MFFYLVAAALLVSAYAEPPVQSRFPNGRIIGGENAVIQKYPYQISMEYNGRHHCGGSIISANYVLSAAHCVYGQSANSMMIRAGSSISGMGGSLHQVQKIIVHENYYVNEYNVPFNDIALLRVKQPFRYDGVRRPISLYGKTDFAYPGQFAVITGWGRTEYTQSPAQLQTVQVPIVSNELCYQAYAHQGGLPHGQICAAYYGVGGKDSCQGDSGGPLAINGRLAGVVSWGNGCGHPDYPGAYTEVAYYRDWIDWNIKF